jgi:hypothetical protein
VLVTSGVPGRFRDPEFWDPTFALRYVGCVRGACVRGFTVIRVGCCFCAYSRSFSKGSNSAQFVTCAAAVAAAVCETQQGWVCAWHIIAS